MVLSIPMLYNILNLAVLIGIVFGIPCLTYKIYKKSIRLNRRLERIERDLKILSLEKEVAMTKLMNSLKS